MCHLPNTVLCNPEFVNSGIMTRPVCICVCCVCARLTWTVGHFLIGLLLAAGPTQVKNALVSLRRKTLLGSYYNPCSCTHIPFFLHTIILFYLCAFSQRIYIVTKRISLYLWVPTLYTFQVLCCREEKRKEKSKYV